MTDTPPSRPAEWMIYPVIRKFIRTCCMAFCICMILTTLDHVLTPFILRHHALAAGAVYLGVVSGGIALLTLCCLSMWSVRVLTASQGSYTTRVLSSLLILPVLYTLLLLFLPDAAGFKYMELRKTLEVVCLMVSITALLAYPYTQGYPAAQRKLFLSWTILGLVNALQSVLIAMLMVTGLHTFSQEALRVMAYVIPTLSGALELTFCTFSVLLSLRLYRTVLLISSMPDIHDPIFSKGK